MAAAAPPANMAERLQKAKRDYQKAFIDMEDAVGKWYKAKANRDRALEIIASLDEDDIDLEHMVRLEDEKLALAVAAIELAERAEDVAKAELIAVGGVEAVDSIQEAVIKEQHNANDRNAAARGHPCSLPSCKKRALYECTKCFSAFYCGPEHQRADWKRHKPVCRALSAKVGGRRKSRLSKQSKRSHRKTKRRY
jgi:hypothetical protein